MIIIIYTDMAEDNTHMIDTTTAVDEEKKQAQPDVDILILVKSAQN